MAELDVCREEAEARIKIKSMNRLISFASFIFFVILFSRCSPENNTRIEKEFSRLEIAQLILDNPTHRLSIWNSISARNQFGIWEDKINHVLSKQIPSEWRVMLLELKGNWSYSMYKQALKSGLLSASFLSEWNDRFELVASEEERYAVIGSIFDYDEKLRTADVARLGNLNISLEDIDLDLPVIQQRAAPGTGSNCDCRWGACPIGGDYQCKPSQTTDCTQTTSGCGFMFLTACTHFCLDCAQWDCENY